MNLLFKREILYKTLLLIIITLSSACGKKAIKKNEKFVGDWYGNINNGYAKIEIASDGYAYYYEFDGFKNDFVRKKTDMPKYGKNSLE